MTFEVVTDRSHSQGILTWCQSTRRKGKAPFTVGHHCNRDRRPVLPALTRTPSIAPLSGELTNPASAATGACAKAPPETRLVNPKLTATTSARKTIDILPDGDIFSCLLQEYASRPAFSNRGRGIQDRGFEARKCAASPNAVMCGALGHVCFGSSGHVRCN